MPRKISIRPKPLEVPTEVRPECIHCYGSGWIFDPTDEDEDRTLPCHMCRDGEDRS